MLEEVHKTLGRSQFLVGTMLSKKKVWSGDVSEAADKAQEAATALRALLGKPEGAQQ